MKLLHTACALLLLLCSPLLAGGPTMHLSQAFNGLGKIQDPELRALLRVDDILEMPVPWRLPEHYSTMRLLRAGDQLLILGRGPDGIGSWIREEPATPGGEAIWRKLTHATPGLSNASGWNQAPYYETLRVEMVGDDLYLLGRASTAVVAYKLNVGTRTWEPLPSHAALTDLSGWNDPVYYSTLRTVVAADRIYLLGRGANGIVTYVFDTVAASWQSIPTYTVMTDSAGWNAGPWYYSTIRAEVVAGDVYLLGRGANGISLHKLDSGTLTWQSFPTYVYMTDAAGWDQVDHYATLRTEVIGDQLYLLGRGDNGIVPFRFDTTSETWSNLPGYGVMTNAEGWNAGPWYYSTLRTEAVGDDLYLFGRGANGIVTSIYDSTTATWSSLATYVVMTDASGWNADPRYYSTIRTQTIGASVFLVARGSLGVETRELDTSTGTWQASARSGPYWSDGLDPVNPLPSGGGYTVDTEVEYIYYAYQNGVLFPDAFNNFPWPAQTVFEQDAHYATFLWSYARYVSTHMDDPLVVAHFLGCIAHVVGDYRLDRYFLGQVEEICDIEAQYALSLTCQAPPFVCHGVQEYVDIWLDNEAAPLFRPLTGVPKLIVYAPPYLADVLYEAFPPGLFSPSLTVLDVFNAMSYGWAYTRSQGPTNAFAALYQGPTCAWAGGNYESALGAVRDAGTAIASYIDKSWGILESGALPRFELGQQGNQFAFWAQLDGRLGHSGLTDFAVGVDASQSTPYTTAAPSEDFEIAEQTDRVSWQRVQSGVSQYDMHRDLIAALATTAGETRLMATQGYLDTAWADWTPSNLAGFDFARFELEQTAPGGDTLRVALALDNGALYAFDRALSQPLDAGSPLATWIATPVTQFQLEGNRLGWLSGDDLWIQTGLAQQPLLALQNVEAFQLEGDRIGALVGGVLKLQEGSGQAWTDHLSGVVDFELEDSLTAALLENGKLKARWGWRTISAGADFPVMTANDGWNAGPWYYSTLRTEVVAGDLYLLARGAGGITTHKLDTATQAWQSFPTYGYMTDASGWDQVDHYSTLRTAVVGDSLYVFGRGDNGIVPLRFDTTDETWHNLSGHGAMSNAGGWNAGPWYYSTLRTEVIGDDIYLIARSSVGMVIYRFDTLLETWFDIPVFGYMTDAAGWDQADHYSTIRTEVIGADLYVLGRGDNGIVTLRFDTLTGQWQSLPGYGVLTNAGGWDQEQYYSSMRTEVVGDDIYLLARASTAIVTYRLDTLTSSWEALPSFGVMRDADGWDASLYRSTLRTEVIADDVYLVARAASGIAVHRLDTETDSWQSVSLGWPYLSDWDSWTEPEYYDSLRTEVVGDSLRLLGRLSPGIQSYSLETGNMAWRTIGKGVEQFALEGGFLAIRRSDDLRAVAAAQLGSPGGPPVPAAELGRFDVIPLGALPAALAAQSAWSWPSMLHQSTVERFHFGSDTKDHSATGSWWLTLGLSDGTLIDYGRQGSLTRSWRQHLPVAKEDVPYQDSRIEVTVPASANSLAMISDRQAVLIEGDLYVKDVW